MNGIKSKKKYIEAWESHIDTLGILRWTPSTELSKEVKQKMDDLKVLVRKIAKDKKLK